MESIVHDLSEGQIDEIKAATEHILGSVGFKVKHEELRRRCREAGAVVDEATENVRLPARLLRELLAQVPTSYKIADLHGNERVVGGQKYDNYSAIVTDPWIIDYETQKPRRPRLADFKPSYADLVLVLSVTPRAHYQNEPGCCHKGYYSHSQ